MNARPKSIRRRGAVLVVVLVCLMVVALMAGVLVRLGLARRDRVRAEERTWQATWLAESGLERASARLADDPAYRGETWESSAEELGGSWGGRVVIEVEPAGADDRTFLVRARADYPRDATLRARRTGRATVVLDAEHLRGEP